VQIADGLCAPAASPAAPSPTASATGTGGGEAGGGQGGSTQAGTSQTTSGSALGYPINYAHSTASKKASKGKTSTVRIVSVSASNALGVKITRVHQQLLRTKTGGQLRLLVTVRDRRARAIRSAIVSIGPVAHVTSTITPLRLGFSNRSGQATFVLPLTRSMLGKRLRLQLVARTPKAQVRVLTSILVPKLLPRSQTRLALAAR